VAVKTLNETRATMNPITPLRSPLRSRKSPRSTSTRPRPTMSTRWASPSIGGTTKAVLQASQGKLQTVYHQSLLPRVPRQRRPYPFSGSISAARLRWIFARRERRSFPSLRTNRGSSASLSPSILMATSFVSSMISAATRKRTTHRTKSRREPEVRTAPRRVPFSCRSRLFAQVIITLDRHSA
jgi:hypothetical protein